MRISIFSYHMRIYREGEIVVGIKIFRQAMELISSFGILMESCRKCEKMLSFPSVLTKCFLRFDAWVRYVYKYISVPSLQAQVQLLVFVFCLKVWWCWAFNSKIVDWRQHDMKLHKISLKLFYIYIKIIKMLFSCICKFYFQQLLRFSNFYVLPLGISWKHK